MNQCFDRASEVGKGLRHDIWAGLFLILDIQMSSCSIFSSCICCSHMIPKVFLFYLTDWVPTQQFFNFPLRIMFFRTPSFALSASKNTLDDIHATLLAVTFRARRLPIFWEKLRRYRKSYNKELFWEKRYVTW